jgi:hypothetical protein
VGVIAGLNERAAGFLTRMVLPLRANLTARHKRGRRLMAGENSGYRCGGGSAVTAS